MIVSCKDDKCICDNIIIPDLFNWDDPWNFDNSLKTRYVCINLPLINQTESDLFTTSQRRTFIYLNKKLTLDFYHDLIDEGDEYSSIPLNSVIFQYKLKFGRLIFTLQDTTKNFLNSVEENNLCSLLKDLKIEEYEQQPVILPSKSILNRIPDSLKQIGITELKILGKKNELMIITDEVSYEKNFDIVIKNVDILSTVLKSDDLITLVDRNGTNRSQFIFVNSSVPKISGFCGVGSRHNSFDYIYFRNK